MYQSFYSFYNLYVFFCFYFVLFCVFFFFFFSSRRRHTRCSRDWSSDVCSSDLTVETTDDCEGSSDEGWALTVTCSAADAGASTMSRCTVCPRLATTPARR